MPNRINKRVLYFVAIGFLLIFAAGGYLYFWIQRPIGSGPAGEPVSATSFSKIWTDKPVLLVGIGDSVTAGFGARHGYSYFDELSSNPSDEFGEMKGKCLRSVLPHLQATNLAISGSTSSEHISQQLPKLLKLDSNALAIVVITTGGNDLIHNYGRTPPREQAMFGASWEQAAPWISDFASRLDDMVEKIKVRFPGGCQIFMANIFDPTDGVGDIARAGLPDWPDGTKILSAYNEVIQKCAAQHSFVHVIDVHGAFLGHGIHCTQFWCSHYDVKDPHYWYYSNLEDPNERGYDVIRRLFLTEIAKVSDRFR